MPPAKIDTRPQTPPGVWCLQVLKPLKANPIPSQPQLAAELDVSLGKANSCPRALVEKGLLKLGNFSKSPNEREHLCALTAAELGEKPPSLAFLKREEAEFEAVQRKINTLKTDPRSTDAQHRTRLVMRPRTPTKNNKYQTLTIDAARLDRRALRCHHARK